LLNINSEPIFFFPKIIDNLTRIQNFLNENDCKSFVIDYNNEIKNKNELLNSLKEACKFPYYSHNWDALTASLREFNSKSKGYFLILLKNRKTFFSLGLDYYTFLDIIKTTSFEWKIYGVVFKLIIGDAE